MCVLLLRNEGLAIASPSLRNNKTHTYIPPFSHPYAPHAQPISFFLILSLAQYWAKKTFTLKNVYVCRFCGIEYSLRNKKICLHCQNGFMIPSLKEELTWLYFKIKIDKDHRILFLYGRKLK